MLVRILCGEQLGQRPRRRASRARPHRRIFPLLGGGTAAAGGSQPHARDHRPRGRGNRKVPVVQRLSEGAIPAWAGEPPSARRSERRGSGHPRVGGGTRATHIEPTCTPGPSPRGRGNLGAAVDAHRLRGAIPAWAGEPVPVERTLTHGQGHPRVGGGTAAAMRSAWGLVGPSPRGRGNHPRIWERGMRRRAIPAWAGEPGPTAPARLRRGGHPRVGGGTGQLLAHPVVQRGPSPRGRGNPSRSGGRIARTRAIPAWAGEPSSASISPRRDGGHPRVGGGTMASGMAMGSSRGPSPRGRGNRPGPAKPTRARRAIPAWAGEPRRG